ncbi:MAG: GFA family protein [Croceibacterium sp.]
MVSREAVGLVTGSGETVPREGSCHCGRVRFTVQLPLELSGARCNCSICSKKGVVMIAAPAAALKVTAGEDLLTVYQFNTMAAKHHFCSRCGIHVYHQRRADPSQVGVNAACLAGVSPYDFAEVPVSDGVSHPLDNGGRFRRVGTLRFEPADD